MSCVASIVGLASLLAWFQVKGGGRTSASRVGLALLAEGMISVAEIGKVAASAGFWRSRTAGRTVPAQRAVKSSANAPSKKASLCLALAHQQERHGALERAVRQHGVVQVARERRLLVLRSESKQPRLRARVRAEKKGIYVIYVLRTALRLGTCAACTCIACTCSRPLATPMDVPVVPSVGRAECAARSLRTPLLQRAASKLSKHNGH